MNARRVNELVAAEVRALQTYHVPTRAGLIKLDAMENPHPLPANLQQAWRAALAEVELNRYPDAGEELKVALRETFGVPPDSELVLGNGSDELIQMLILLVARGRVVLAPTPTFSMYAQIATACHAKFVGVPLRDDFHMDAAAMQAAIDAHQPACIFFAYPNNPTGNCFDRDIIIAALRQTTGLVVVDEAYFAFCAQSFYTEISRFENLIVLRTLSKSGLAALRLGFLAAPRPWAAELEKLRLPYNINTLTQYSARFFLQNYAVLRQQAEDIVRAREQIFAQLNSLAGVRAYPSAANFILLRLEGDANAVFTRLKQRGVLVKNLCAADPALQNCLRVTIGTPEENRQFMDALRAILRDEI